jgi:hypothetical protein
MKQVISVKETYFHKALIPSGLCNGINRLKPSGNFTYQQV